MKISVTLELNDSNELAGLGQFINEVEAYRNPAKVAQQMAATMSDPRNGASEPVDPIDIQTPPVSEQVVASIAPEGVVKAPKTADLNEAALAYVKKHGMDGALKLLGKYGAQKITEIKDPAKLVALYAELQAGVK